MFQKILIPLDGSQLAEQAIPVALEVAKKFESEIVLARIVVPPYPITHVSGPPYGDMLVGLRDIVQDEAQGYVQDQEAILQRQGFRVTTEVVEGEPIAEQILKVAKSQQVNLIVMGTHGRGGLGRWVYGSVAERVLRHADVPVLLTRSTDL